MQTVLANLLFTICFILTSLSAGLYSILSIYYSYLSNSSSPSPRSRIAFMVKSVFPFSSNSFFSSYKSTVMLIISNTYLPTPYSTFFTAYFYNVLTSSSLFFIFYLLLSFSLRYSSNICARISSLNCILYPPYSLQKGPNCPQSS